MYNREHIIMLMTIIAVSAFCVACIINEPFNPNAEKTHTNIDAIYYINLNKRDDRNSEFLDNFNEVDESKLIRVPAHYYPENGAVGCLMSHITALNRAYNDNHGENILICEDDLEIKDMAYCNKMLNLLLNSTIEWDVIMFGQNTIYADDTELKTEQDEKVIRIRSSQTTSGYMIKREYIPRLLEIYERDMNQYLKTGDWGNYFTDQSWKVLQETDRWYSFKPAIAIQRASYSDIVGGNVNYGV